MNTLSSYGTDSPLDKKVKFDLMKDTFTLLNLSIKRKKKLKKEKTENFNRRQMGEKGPNKIEKEMIRKKNQAARDEFDLANIGGYRLVYPVLNNIEKAQKFDSFIDHAKLLWAEGGTNNAASIAQ